MRIFFYALREYDELLFVQKYQKELHFEWGYTSAYPSLDNAHLADGYDAISIITNIMFPELLDRFYAGGVRYIATRSIGYEHMNLKYCKKLGIRTTNVTYAPMAVADYTIMMMLIGCRKLPFIMKQAENQNFSLEGKMGRELSLSTVGIIGTGKIGECLIHHLQGFGCKILAYDPYPKKHLENLAEYTDLETIYRKSDIITLHAPAFESNYHMIDQRAFSLMKNDVIIVNAARGSLIDTEALIQNLENQKVGFAALDTFENEKGLYYLNLDQQIMANRDRAILQSFPNVLLSPHMAFYTEQSVSDMVGNAIKGLLDFEKGEENPFEVTL